jgi:OmpA-OmpF porin, OOP family
VKNIFPGLILLLSFMLHANAANRDVNGSKDHDLISRYPNSTIMAYEYRDYEEVNLPLGAVTGSSKAYQAEKSIDLEGALTRITYLVKEQTSTIKVYRNYEAALRSAGFKELFSCSATQCGKQEIWGYALGQLSLLNGKQKTARYLAGEMIKGDSKIYVGLFVMERHDNSVVTGLTVVETRQMQTGLVAVDVKALRQQLSETGKVAIYGIHFDTDKSDLREDSNEMLDIIHQLLDENKALKLYIVGHTDDTGNLSHNIELSRRRAEAVVSVLVSRYGVDVDRLEAFGAGPYAPVASNASNDGQAKNRRVELVERLE